MSKFQNDSIFWIEVEKIKPNPYQPRKEFDQEKLSCLSESIRQYGVLQPLVVTRKEVEKEDGGLMAEYELIAGERRLRASKMAGLAQVPAIIRSGEDDDGLKLELAIIENLQREDLNPIDRALAFQRLADEFNFKHIEIAKKVGKSREYVTNSIRLLTLPEEIRNAIVGGQITEGHARPILMLKDRPEEQSTLFKEIIYKKMTVRDAESIARKIAFDRVRKKEYVVDPEIVEMEERLAESLGTRVHIERKDTGGKVTIDFFSNDDLKNILDLIHSNEKKSITNMMDNYISLENKTLESVEEINQIQPEISKTENEKKVIYGGSDFITDTNIKNNDSLENKEIEERGVLYDDEVEIFPSNDNSVNQENNHSIPDFSTVEKEEKSEKISEDEDLYSIKDFSI